MEYNIDYYGIVCYTFATGKKQMHKFKDSSFIVLEFNSATIRVCRSVIHRSRRVVTHCFSFPISLPWQELPNELRSHFKKHKLCVKQAVLMLPRDKAISYSWTFPSNNEEEIRQMVRLRILKECLGVNRDSNPYDFKIIGFDSEGCARVVVFLLQQQHVNQYAEVMRRAGIVIEGVTINTAGLLNWLKFVDCLGREQKNENVFFLNADDGTFDFQLLADGNGVFSRSFHLGASQNTLDGLKREIKLSMELCRRQYKNFHVAEASYGVCVTGPYDSLLGLDIEAFAHKEFRAFDPLEDARLYLELKNCSLRSGPVSYAAVMGLALVTSYDGLDLMPASLRRKRDVCANKKIIKRILYYFTVFFLVIFLIYSFSVRQNILYLLSLGSQLQASSGIEGQVRSMLSEAYFDKKVFKDGHIAEVLNKLYEKTPGSISFLSLYADESRSMVLSGFAENLEALSGYFSNLRADSAFKGIRMDFSREEGDKHEERIKFRLSWKHS